MASFLDGRTILVVDDEEAVREYVREILRPAGTNLRILEAGNGQEALDILDANLPHIILLDLKMPVMDGYVFLERCRENPKTTWVPILVLTAYTQAEAEIDVLDSGANDFMTKPIARLELMARMRSLLRTHSRVEQLQAQVKKRDEIIRSLAKTLEEHIGKEKTKGIVEGLGLKQPSH